MVLTDVFPIVLAKVSKLSFTDALSINSFQDIGNRVCSFDSALGLGWALVCPARTQAQMPPNYIKVEKHMQDGFQHSGPSAEVQVTYGCRPSSCG